MRQIVILGFLCALLSSCAAAQPPAPRTDQEEWIRLFNGANMDGWQVKIRGYSLGDNFGNTFRVEDGVLTVGYEQYDDFSDRFGHLFHEKPFSHYVLAVEYRFVGEQASGGPEWAFRNSGVMFHSQSASSMLENQDFPISIEAQFLGGRESGERPTANLCTPGTHVEMDGELITRHCVDSESETLRGDQWVRVELRVLGGDKVEHWVNGRKVLEYEKPQIGGGVVNDFDPAQKPDGQLLDNGYIALQSESHPIEFRRVELLNLKGCMDPEATNFKSYYVKAENSTCRYP